MRRFILFLFVVLFLLCGCQPTPEEAVVVNKGDGALESAISSEPMGEYAAESGETTVETLQDALGAPERASLTLTGPVYGGTLHVEMDAALHVPGVSRVPVLRVGRLHPSAGDSRATKNTVMTPAITPP